MGALVTPMLSAPAAKTIEASFGQIGILVGGGTSSKACSQPRTARPSEPRCAEGEANS